MMKFMGKKIIYISLLLAPILLYAWVPAPMGEVVAPSRQGAQTVSCDSWRCAGNCLNIQSEVEAALASVGAEANLSCYMDLFYHESTCRPRLGQPQGTAGNPAAGFGLCTLETRADLRRNRGRNCRAASVDNIAAQVLCCRDIMIRHGGAYFGPVARGTVARCERN